MIILIMLGLMSGANDIADNCGNPNLWTMYHFNGVSVKNCLEYKRAVQQWRDKKINRGIPLGYNPEDPNLWRPLNESDEEEIPSKTKE